MRTREYNLLPKGNFCFTLLVKYDFGAMQKFDLKKCVDYKSLLEKLNSFIPEKECAKNLTEQIYFKTDDLILNEIKAWQI